MGQIKYIPQIVAVLTLVLFFFAFNPLAAFLASFGLFSIMFANIVAAILILIPTLFIVGINSNRKVFGFIMLILGLLLIIGFFLFA